MQKDRFTLNQTFCIEDWWRMTGSNRRPPACKAGALPAELIPRSYTVDQPAPPDKTVVGLDGFEPSTPALSRRCSNRLSYRPLSLSAFVFLTTADKREHLKQQCIARERR